LLGRGDGGSVSHRGELTGALSALPKLPRPAVLGLSAVILATCFVVVAAAVRTGARNEIDEELRLAATLFVRQLESRSQQLVAATD
jgi:hypothetical protein